MVPDRAGDPERHLPRHRPRVRDLPANLERVLLGQDLAKGGSAKACKLGLKTA